jgi:hypothetical protein
MRPSAGRAVKKLERRAGRIELILGKGRCDSGDPARTMSFAWPKALRQTVQRTRIRPNTADEPD